MDGSAAIVDQREAQPPRPDPAALLSVDRLSVRFDTTAGTVHAVEAVSFDLRRDQVLAIVGESGSGKSVTSLALMKLIPTPPGRYVAGRVLLDGQDLLSADEAAMTRIRGKRISMIFQNPRGSLDPSFTIARQMHTVLRRHMPTLDRRARDVHIRDMVDQLHFPEPDRLLASYPHQLSGGMCQRAAIAIALLCTPEILIADEPTTALDRLVSAAILDLLRGLHRRNGLPIVIVTHDFDVVRMIATDVIVMYGGQVQEQGPVVRVLTRPRHPYAQALLASVPSDDRLDGRLVQIEGRPPSLLRRAAGCHFAPRCTSASAQCRHVAPPPYRLRDGTLVRCHLLGSEAVGIAS